MVTPEVPNTNNQSAAVPTETAGHVSGRQESDSQLADSQLADSQLADSQVSGRSVADITDSQTDSTGSDNAGSSPVTTNTTTTRAKEIGGQKGPEPTRYGDWEKNGRCTDF